MKSSVEISLDDGGSGPLYIRIASSLKRKILRKELLASELLPSVRSLAKKLKTSPPTVVKAYRILEEEGLISSVPGSGHYVCSLNVAEHTVLPRKKEFFIGQEPQRLLSSKKLFFQQVFEETQNFGCKPLSVYGSPMGQVLDKNFLRIAAHQIRNPRTWERAAYQPYQASSLLRKKLCEYLRRYRNIICKPEQIVITSGTNQSFNLICRVLLEKGDKVIFEGATLPMHADIFRSYGIDVLFEAEKKGGPSGGFPDNTKGVIFAPVTRILNELPVNEKSLKRLYSRLSKNGGWLIEDGTNKIFLLENKAPTIRALPGAEKFVIYMESFSLQISVDVKLAFLVVPEYLAKSFNGARILLGRDASERTQNLISAFLEPETFGSYQRKLEQKFKAKFDFFFRLVNQELSDFGHLVLQNMTPHVIFKLNDGLSDLRIARMAAQKNVQLVPLSTFSGVAPEVKGFLLGYIAFTEKEILEAIKVVRQCCLSEKASSTLYKKE